MGQRLTCQYAVELQGRPKFGGMSARNQRTKNNERRPERRPNSRWSARVTHGSDALDLEPGVFKKDRPEDIARSLAHSAEQSERRKAEPFQSAMSMLTFYINRAGKNLSVEDRKRLEAAKDALRRRYGRPTPSVRTERKRERAKRV